MELDELLEIAKKAIPPVEGKVALPKLKSPVEVLWDDWGIPHIYGESLEDVMSVQGYIHARYRLFQMELYRRKFFGRLSEILGEATIPSDKQARIIGMHRVARERAQFLREHPESEVTKVLESYRQGVNYGIQTAKENPPLEFALLDFEPGEWQIEESLVIVEMMDWQESRNMDYEVLRAALVEKLGVERANKFFPLNEGALTLEAVGGSNAWAISPGKSATGQVILCNDPHLTFTNPMIWMLVHLNYGETSVIGVSIPGVPGIVIGHNTEIGWGITNLEADTQDLYRLEVNPENPDEYRLDGEWVKFEIINEPIKVKGEEQPLDFRVRKSKFGPVHEFLEREDDLIPLPLDGTFALKWGGYVTYPDETVAAFFRLNQATSWPEAREALANAAICGHNCIYGDRAGNIVHQHWGIVAIRPDGLDGTKPVDGNTIQNDWRGVSTLDQMWMEKNPDRGFVFTANYNPDNSPGPAKLLICKDSIGLSRYLRLKELLEGTDKVTLANCEEFQLDTVSTEARQYLPVLLDLLGKATSEESSGITPDIIETLKAWDHDLDRGSRGAALYLVWVNNFFRRVLEPILEGQMYEAFISNYPFNVLRLVNMYQAEGRETELQDLLRGSLEDAIAWLTENVGKKLSRWTWGNVHKVTLTHPFAQVDPAAEVLNIGPFKVGGDRNTLNNGHYASHDYHLTAGPSLRQVFDFSDWDNSRFIIPGGQAGLPFHKHYNDLMKLWVRGKYIPACFTREKIESHLDARQNFVPSD